MNELLNKRPLPKEALETIGPNAGVVKTLAESILSNPDILTGLNRNIGGGDKDVILESIIFHLKADFGNQEPFINSLFDELAIEDQEGKWIQANRRDAAFTILTDQVFKPTIDANLIVVIGAYLNAINLQSFKNDPFSGSIDVLLETGKSIIPYFPRDPDLKKQIIRAWERVVKEFLPKSEEAHHIKLGLKKIKYIMSPNWVLDNKIEELRKGGLGNAKISEELNLSKSRVNTSIQRLLDQGRVERRKAGPRKKSSFIVKRDNQVKKLRDKGKSDAEIAEKLNLSTGRVNASIHRLLDQGRIERRKAGPRKKSSLIVKRDNQVKKLRDKGLSNSEIAEKLNLSTGCVSVSIQRLLDQGKIERKRDILLPLIVKRDNQVKKLIDKGLSNSEIAEKLNLSRNDVIVSASRLLKKGRIERRK